MVEPSNRAAQYVRMSTEHQQYSLENQSAAIRAYAERHGLAVVRTFADAGKSGLRLEGRAGLRELIDVVQSGRADFATVLVYDVSRWGRFQDADESAYYEYLCKRAGISVRYCTEPFENDGSPLATILKGVKRAMAGEYSRELSAKVFQGQCRLIELGFRQGGAPGYGLRRMLVDHAGQPKGELRPGERKSLQTDRVVLVPGPPEEVAVVQRIYRLFVEEHRGEDEIAAALARDGVPWRAGRAWTRDAVRGVLTDEKYVGHNVYNRISFKLKRHRVRNPPAMWVRRERAFPAIIEPSVFAAAQAILAARRRRFTDDELLDHLRALHRAHGTLSAALLDGREGAPSSAVYRRRFGSLTDAWRRVGFVPAHALAVAARRRLRQQEPALLDALRAALANVGARVEHDAATGRLLVDGRLSVAVLLARYDTTAAGTPRWSVRSTGDAAPDLTVVVRMDATNRAPRDYYVLPAMALGTTGLRLAVENGAGLDAWRVASLDAFFRQAAPVCIEEAA